MEVLMLAVTGAGFNDNVTALAIQPDGKLL
jgi:hypothetical protein